MSLSIGIVGLPNVGKSTLFNALLKRQAALAANYPFATIEPNVGVVDVPDPRLDKLAEFVRNDYGRKMGDREVPGKIIPATVKFYDIAGLVKGASQGEGLGNEFLGHIRDVDAIVHLVKAFKDDNVVEAGSGYPEEDIEIINTELILADIQSLERTLQKLEAEAKRGTNKEVSAQFELMTNILKNLQQGKMPNSMDLDDDISKKLLLSGMHLLTAKPMIYVFNVSESDLGLHCEHQALIDRHYGIKISARIESELYSLEPEEQRQYMLEVGISNSSMDKVISRGYKLLNLESFLTMGPKEVRAWTIKEGAKAPQAAGVIHTDFEKGFISAEVIGYEELCKVESLKIAREKGMVRLEGKDYVVRDGDVVEFRFNV